MFEMPTSLEDIHIACVVTDEYLLDFLILYQSLVESWTSYPFTLHAFVVEDEVLRRLAGLELENLEIHRLPSEVGDWRQNAAQKIELVEHSGLERCIVSDVDNIFLAETPELSLLLSDHDFVFVGGPSSDRPIQTSLWSFRRTERSIQFANRWRGRSLESNPSHTSRLLAELLEGDDLEGAVRALTLLAPIQHGPGPSPYGVDADLPRLSLQQDPLGFREARAGRVKVLHFAGMRARGNRSLADRIELLVQRFPRTAPILRQYARLARRPVGRLGLEAVRRSDTYVRDRLLEGGIPETRNHLPALLNKRGLGETGVEVGVKIGVYSETLLRGWRGRMLISVDPWTNGPPDDYVDSTTPAEHERFYRETLERLDKFGKRSAVWRMTSVEAASRIEPKTLDFVYLDARHDYRSVREDLEHWFDKIRAGGVFAGHDYMDSLDPSFQVKQAVDEFFASRGLLVKATYGEGRCATWLVEIPT
jgi:hypothetical protein